MDREERARAFQNRTTGETGTRHGQKGENQRDYGQPPVDRLERERRRQAARRKQIRRRIAAFILMVALLVAVIVTVVLASGKEEASKAGNKPLETPSESAESRYPEATEGNTQEEESETPPAEGDMTAYLRELQTRMPDYIEQDFIPVNEFSRPGYALGEINNIVIHYVGNAGTEAASNLSYFKQLANQTPGDENAVKASSNFIVGLEGEVIQCMPIYEVAYCSNFRNWDTLSIEVCHPDAAGKFSDVTYDSVVQLCAWLCNELDLTEDDLIRHYDVTKKKCPLYYVDHPEAWEQLKADVGAALAELQK